MRESLFYISNTMDVFSTKIAGTLIESDTFDFLSENLKGVNVFRFSGNEFQSSGTSHLKLSFPRHDGLACENLVRFK